MTADEINEMLNDTPVTELKAAVVRMAAIYHRDTTDLARRALELEFREQLDGNPELADQLGAATRLRHVAGIRERLEPVIKLC